MNYVNRNVVGELVWYIKQRGSDFKLIDEERIELLTTKDWTNGLQHTSWKKVKQKIIMLEERLIDWF